MRAVFAIQPARSGNRWFENPFAGTRRVTIAPAGPDPVSIEIVAAPGATLQTYRDEQSGQCAYLWGRAAHPKIAESDLLRWCLQTISAGNLSALAELLGLFVLIIDDRRAGRVRFVSDLLATRPWFVGTHAGRLVAGSDVWAIQAAGLSSDEVDYQSVGAWVYHVYDCAGGSLFKDYRRLPPGSITTWESGTLTDDRYIQYEVGDQIISQEELADTIHRSVSGAFDALVGQINEVSLALSGGFDSRYLAALASRRSGLQLHSYVVCNERSEAEVARQVAEALGVSLKVIPTDGTAWNMFDEPYLFMADGFPVTKQVSELVAAQHPGVPVLNGFMGDPLIRGSRDRHFGKLDREATEDPAAVLFRVHDSGANRLDLLRPAIHARVRESGRDALRRSVESLRALGKPYLSVLFFNRHPYYIANNFLQHLGIAEPILPFYNRELLALRFSHDYSCFTWELYQHLLRAQFPEIGDIPHNSKVPTAGGARPPVSRCSRKWAIALMGILARPGNLSGVDRRKVLPRLAGVAAGRRDVEVVAVFLQRLWLLEQRLRRAGIEVDWNAI